MQNEEFQRIVLEKLSSIDNEINQINTTQEKRFKSVDQRFEKIDQRFELIDQRFEKIDQRFDQIDQRFEKIDQRFEKIDRRFEKVEEQIHILNIKHDETFEVVKAIEHSNNISRAMLDKHEFEIAKNKADIKRIKKAINLV